MSIPAFAWAIEQGHAHNLLPSDRLVLIYLADKANGVRVCWPGQETIVKYTGLALRTVRAALPRLAKAKLIQLEERSGRATVYHILREDSPTPRQDVAGSHPATPANGAGVSMPDPGNQCIEPRQLVAPTPAIRPPEPYLSKKEEPKRRASAPEARLSDSGDVGKEAGHADPAAPDPLDRPVDPGQFQALLASLTRGFQNNYPPRVSGLSRAEQIEAMADKPAWRPGAVSPEQLAALRRNAGIRLEAPA
jgi:hypothetical protein